MGDGMDAPGRHLRAKVTVSSCHLKGRMPPTMCCSATSHAIEAYSQHKCPALSCSLRGIFWCVSARSASMLCAGTFPNMGYVFPGASRMPQP